MLFALQKKTFGSEKQVFWAEPFLFRNLQKPFQEWRNGQPMNLREVEASCTEGAQYVGNNALEIVRDIPP
jgi:hypothetical protein